MIFSCIIPASKKDAESQNLKDLIASIKAQDFPQDQIEILVITEGDSESAKAIGIRQAKGEICAMFCADNMLMDKRIFREVKKCFDVPYPIGVYAKFYWYKKEDNSLNRYFSLMGNNDPIAYYLRKCDRKPAWEENEDEGATWMCFRKKVPSLGDNGFFFRTEYLKKADIKHYYPMDVAEDLRKQGFAGYTRCNGAHIWHRTSDNLISFLKKRYRYARDLYCDRDDRRWKMLDTREDYIRLALFALGTITIIQPLALSIRGFCKIRDVAWFWHWPVCVGFLVTYTILAIRNLFKYGALFQKPALLSPLSAATKV